MNGKPSECELIVLKCVYDLEKESAYVTCFDIIARLKDKYKLNYADTTVYTFLKNLKRKNYLESERIGVTRYSTRVPFEELREEYYKNFMEFWFEETPKNPPF